MYIYEFTVTYFNFYICQKRFIHIKVKMYNNNEIIVHTKLLDQIIYCIVQQLWWLNNNNNKKM